MNETANNDPYAAPASNTAVAPTDSLLAAYVGPKSTDYYLSRFERFQRGGGKLSWHWPAFFITSYWLLYRKMWLWALVYIIGLPILFFGLALALFSGFANPAQAEGLANGLYLLLIFVAAPLLANWLYYRQAEGKVASVSAAYPGAQERAMELARRGGTSLAWILVLVIVLVGILAAIAIPAYQDYTIRAQVAEGIARSQGAQHAVAEGLERTGEWPADNAAAGIDEPSIIGGTYVESVVVRNGVVEVYYGNEAHELLAGASLVFEPSVNRDGDVAWTCGSESIEMQHLPAACR